MNSAMKSNGKIQTNIPTKRHPHSHELSRSYFYNSNFVVSVSVVVAAATRRLKFALLHRIDECLFVCK